MEENSFMAGLDREKQSATLLRRSLSNPGDACPDPEILGAHFERSLDAEETKRYELHLSRCAHCREMLAAMDRAGALIAAEDANTQQPAHGGWMWNWRWLAPVAAVVLIAAIWAVRRPSLSHMADQATEHPIMAMYQPQQAVPSPTTREAAPETSAAAPVATFDGKPASAPTHEMDSAKKQNQLSTRSRSLDDKEEFASNLPSNTRDEARSDELTKDTGVMKRDSADAANKVASQPTPSQAVAPSTPPAAPPPPALVASAAAPTSSGATGGAASEVDRISPQSPATNTKPSGVVSGTRTLTQQAQTLSVEQSQALAFEASAKLRPEMLIPSPDQQVLWRISRQGSVERSIDGGENWKKQLNELLGGQFASGSAPSAEVCWLVGRNGVIFMTKDGNHWKTVPFPTAVDIAGVIAKDARTATITAADGRTFSTTDAGKHWNPAP
jgi:Photosynthesis system II assembly factor YCF48